MQNLQDELLEIANKYVKKVAIDLKHRKCKVMLDRSVEPQEAQKIKIWLAEMIPTAEDIIVVVPETSNNNIDNIEQKLELTTENLQKIKSFLAKKFGTIPILKTWLKSPQWKVSNNELVLFFNNQVMVDILKIKKIDQRLQEEISKFFLQPVKITFKIEKDQVASCEKYENEEAEIIKMVLNEGDETKNSNDSAGSVVIIGKNFSNSPVFIKDCLNLENEEVIVAGEIMDWETKQLRNNRKLVTVSITDYTNSIYLKLFYTPNQNSPDIEKQLERGITIKVRGRIEFDAFIKDKVIIPRDIVKTERVQRLDKAEKKRVELHLHTQMSAMDATNSPADYIKKASEWGHKAIAITDHGVVQSFPEAYLAGKDYGIKIIYGVEGYLIDDCVEIVEHPPEEEIDDVSFVVFDTETTGLSPLNEEIIEIGAVKIKAGDVVDRFSSLVKCSKDVPYHITKLTGITNDMVKNAPPLEKVMNEFRDFCEGSVLVAHNAKFDMGFVNKSCAHLGIKINRSVLDTLLLARALFPNMKNYKLSTLCKYFNIRLVNHHRAVDDAEATAKLFIRMLNAVQDKGIHTLKQINKLSQNIDFTSLKPYHVIVLAKNQHGLKSLYKLVSESHINYFYRTPRIPRRMLDEHRENLIIGSACESGEVFSAILSGKEEEELKDICKFYDFLEVQPLENNRFLIEKGLVKNREELKNINRKLVQIGKELDIPVVATGDVHFLDPEHSVFRKILLHNKGYEDIETQPPLYFRTTDEMLEEFSYLGRQKAEEIVVVNSNKIADMIEEIQPIPDKLYAPKIEGADEFIRELTYSKAREIYGSPLPDIIEKRLKKELDAIIGNGFAVIYYISHKLVKKSLDDGYLVGSRGSVGSSFVATMCGITEVNPLPPHYVCLNCKHSIFDVDHSKYGVGPDLPDKICPRCGKKMKKDGYNIPFEVFMGFKGDKVPDIDLNFSGDYQPKAHKYTEKLFGKDYVFRAGTIGTVAEKTAFGFVKGYVEDKKLAVHKAELDRLTKGCTGAKRTTGQHPGGLMVVPKDKEVYDFTPIQYPANDKSSGVITTHFDYHAISSRLLKLDILGHDDPTVLKMLEDLTGISPQTIPLDDDKTLGIFSSAEPLGLDDETHKVGTLGVPEFGTNFVRQMLIETKPKTFEELIRISGLSHGTDVWLNNAQDLIKQGVANLSEVIATRDDIMTYLINKGVEPRRAFFIMERVRKGKGLEEEDIQVMKASNVPDWYIESCQKIKYMFPKAHAVAYVIMAFRIAFFKVHYPEAFYAAYFTVKAEDFDADLILRGPRVIKEKIDKIQKSGSKATSKEKNLLTVLEVALEMYMRGLKFVPVDLYKSHYKVFKITENGLLPPFISLQGVGERAARNIFESRKKSKFLSIEDLQTRAKLTRTVINVLKEHGCLHGLQETNQLSFFNLAKQDVM